ncbi:hypothetical protein W239_02657, partial [Staphylococcus aureus DAR1810]
RITMTFSLLTKVAMSGLILTGAIGTAGLVSVPVANVEAKAAEFNPKVDKLLKFEVSKK